MKGSHTPRKPYIAHTRRSHEHATPPDTTAATGGGGEEGSESQTPLLALMVTMTQPLTQREEKVYAQNRCCERAGIVLRSQQEPPQTS